MGLETLLEAAEFLESRGKGDDGRRLQNGSDRRTSLSEPGTSRDDNDSHDGHDGTFKEPRSRTKSGRMSPIYVGPPDSFFMRAGTREVHNKLEKNRKITKGKEFAPYISTTHNWLEKNRRAHLKECFDFLKKTIPSLEDKRTSNLGILRSSLRYIQNLKRKEREYELEMQRFAHEKIVLQEKMQSLKNELNNMNIELDLNAWVANQDNDNETNSTSTATERGTPPPSDHDENDDDEEEAERLAMETNPSPTPRAKNARKEYQFNSKTTEPAHHVRHIFPVPTGKSSSLGKSLSAVKSPSSAHVNEFITRHNSLTLKSAANKTIPITLSLSGPVPQPGIVSVFGSAAPSSGYVAKVTELPTSRTPVTQILHRTLTQRQALMKQSLLSAQGQVLSAPMTAAQLKSPPRTRPPAPVVMTTTQAPSPLVTKEIQFTAATLQQQQSAIQLATSNQGILPNKLPTVTGAVPLTFPYYMASLQKIAHPILVTSLMAPALGVTTTAATAVSALPTPVSNMQIKTDIKSEQVTSASPLTPVSNIPIKTEIKSEQFVSPSPVATVTNLNYLTTPVMTTMVSQPIKSETPTTAVTASPSFPIRPIFAPSLINSQVWPFLTTIPRTNVVVQSANIPGSQTASAVLSSANNQVTSVPVVSIAQLNQLTQMMAPMTVMSPGIQMAPGTLTQTQLNNMFASTPLLKQFQLPLGLSSSLIQSGQVLGQQVVKPVVVVTVPNVVTQATPSLATNVSVVTTSV